ncbi:hypothetical protein GCM10009780_75480 [Actinomadura alba]
MPEHTNPVPGSAPELDNPMVGTERSTGRGDDPTRLVIVASSALGGVPAAYIASHSVPGTAIAAAVAAVLVYLGSRRRPPEGLSARVVAHARTSESSREPASRPQLTRRIFAMWEVAHDGVRLGGSDLEARR